MKILFSDDIFRHLVVQRQPRLRAREPDPRDGKAAAFPERNPPQVAEYSIRKTYGRLLDMFENAFTAAESAVQTPDVLPTRLVQGTGHKHRSVRTEPAEASRWPDPYELPQALREAPLSRSNFPVTGCSRSLWPSSKFTARPLRRRRRLGHWKSVSAEALGYARSRQLEMWGDENEKSEDEDVVPQEMLEAVKRLDRDQFDVPAMITETFRDLDQLVHFTAEAREVRAQARRQAAEARPAAQFGRSLPARRS